MCIKKIDFAYVVMKSIIVIIRMTLEEFTLCKKLFISNNFWQKIINSYNNENLKPKSIRGCMSNLQKGEFDIIYDKFHQIYPSVALDVLPNDIIIQEKNFSRTSRKLYQYFFNSEKKKKLEKILLRQLPILRHEDFKKIEKIFLLSHEFKHAKKVDKQNFIHAGLHLVELFSGVEKHDWDEVFAKRRKFFEDEITPLVRDFRKNKIKYWWWCLQNIF